MTQASDSVKAFCHMTGNSFIDGAFHEALNSQLSRAAVMTLSSVPPTIQREIEPQRKHETISPVESAGLSSTWLALLIAKSGP